MNRRSNRGRNGSTLVMITPKHSMRYDTTRRVLGGKCAQASRRLLRKQKKDVYNHFSRSSMDRNHSTICVSYLATDSTATSVSRKERKFSTVNTTLINALLHTINHCEMDRDLAELRRPYVFLNFRLFSDVSHFGNQECINTRLPFTNYSMCTIRHK